MRDFSPRGRLRAAAAPGSLRTASRARYRCGVDSRVRAPFAALALLCAASACGGGSGAAPAAVAPTPTPTPVPTPAGALSVAPASLPNFTSAGQTGTFTAAEPQYTGSFTAVADAASCTSSGAAVATVTPSAAAAGNATFTVTAGTAAGVCTIAVGDVFGQKTAVTVTVTFTQGTLR